MLFYFVTRDDISKIPFETYKNNLIVLTFILNDAYDSHYRITFDYNLYFQSKSYNQLMLLYNLTDADLVHLNLLGIPIKSALLVVIGPLEKAIIEGDDIFVHSN